MHITLVYETQTGTTQYVAELLRDAFAAAGHTVVLHSLVYQGKEPDISHTDLLLVGAPTYDDGKLEKSMREWTEQFRPDLSQLPTVVFALGNRSYPQFCVAADLLEAWVRECGGRPLIPALRVDGFPDKTAYITKFAHQVLATAGA